MTTSKARAEEIVSAVEEMRADYQAAFNRTGIPQIPLTRMVAVARDLDVHPDLVQILSGHLSEDAPRDELVDVLAGMLLAAGECDDE